MKTRALRSLTALVVLAWSLTAAFAQVDLEAFNRDVLGLVDAGRWQDATRRVDQALPRCPEGIPGQNCRLALTYIRGYVFQRAAEMTEDPAGRGPHLEKAARE